MKMTSKQRLITALQGGEPDRVPVAPHFSRDYVGHYMRKTDTPIVGYEEWIDSYFAAYKNFGFDAMLQIWCEDKHNNDGTWKTNTELKTETLEYKLFKITITTPEGELVGEYKVTKSPQSHWTMSYLIKNPEDIALLKYQPDPLEYMDITPLKFAQEKVGDDGLAYGLVLGVWHAACNLRNADSLMMDFFDRPEWIKAFFRILADYAIMKIEAMSRSGIQLIEIGESFLGMGLSPSVCKEFILPYDTEIVRACLDKGIMTLYHNCGQCHDLLELMADTGTTALETLTPPSMGGNADLRDAKRRIGNRLCLRGSIDQHILKDGNTQTIENHVENYVQDAGTKGGFIIGTGEFGTDIPMANLFTLVNAVNKYGYY